MIRYLYGHDLNDCPDLRSQMFRDRAAQFAVRQGWQVHVNADGEEIDEYDAEDPLYVIATDENGRHAGSMRFLPTTGPTMVNDHFRHLTDGVRIESPLIWECTRFCLSENGGPGTAAALMLAGGELMRRFAVEHFVGVFDARMIRIYRRLGASPEVLGSQGEGREQLSVGLWAFTGEAQERLSQRASHSPNEVRHWFEAAFGTGPYAAKFAA